MNSARSHSGVDHRGHLADPAIPYARMAKGTRSASAARMVMPPTSAPHRFATALAANAANIVPHGRRRNTVSDPIPAPAAGFAADTTPTPADPSAAGSMTGASRRTPLHLTATVRPPPSPRWLPSSIRAPNGHP